MNPVPLEKLERLAAEGQPTPQAPQTGAFRGTARGGQGDDFDLDRFGADYVPRASFRPGSGTPANGTYTSRLVVERWLEDRSVGYRVKPTPDAKGRTVYVLVECPFDPTHRDPDACIMQEPGGKLSAQCFHNSCTGRGWRQFKEKIGKPERHHYDPPLHVGQAAPPLNEDSAAEGQPGPATVLDFYAYLPQHAYLFVPSRQLWPAESVNSRFRPIGTGQNKISASTWLDRYRAVEQMTWMPGEPLIIKDRLISAGGWIHRPGCSTFNLYQPPQVQPGDWTKATPWLDHVRLVYPDDANHIVAWLAHRVQRPGEKVNHALVLGGAQGIGKDTLLDPVKSAVGPWNFTEVSPHHLMGRFNGFVKSVILRVSEARDLGDVDRYAFYEHMKVYTAAPPDVLRMDEKHLREVDVPNVCGVVVTTNHKTDGIYLPGDDRRHYVGWSELAKEDFFADYWKQLYGWYEAGGRWHVAAYLAAYDLSSFDPKAPPPHTAAWHAIVDANAAPEDAELADALDLLNWPPALTLTSLAGVADLEFRAWLTDRKYRRVIPHRLEAAGYVPVRNESPKNGLWKVEGRRQVIYARSTLPLRERLAAAMTLAGAGCGAGGGL